MKKDKFTFIEGTKFNILYNDLGLVKIIVSGTDYTRQIAEDINIPVNDNGSICCNNTPKTNYGSYIAQLITQRYNIQNPQGYVARINF